MKAKLIALGAASLLTLAACCSSTSEEDAGKVIQLGTTPQNLEPVILLQNQTTGELACCRDTVDVTPEEWACALYAFCSVGVRYLPYLPSNYYFLTPVTFPPGRCLENQNAPRW